MLSNGVKNFIKNSVYIIGVEQIKTMLELYGIKKMEIAFKIINRIRKKEGLIILNMYPLFTESHKAGALSHAELIRAGYWLDQNGFYRIYK